MTDKENRIYRSYRRMSDEERITAGYPSRKEELEMGFTPISVVLGFDPFIVHVDKTWDQLSDEEKESVK